MATFDSVVKMETSWPWGTQLTSEHVTFFDFLEHQSGLTWCCTGSFALSEYIARHSHYTKNLNFRANDVDIFCVLPKKLSSVRNLLSTFTQRTGIRTRDLNHNWISVEYDFCNGVVKGIVDFYLETSTEYGRDAVKPRVQLIFVNEKAWAKSSDSDSFDRYVTGGFDIDIVRVWLKRGGDHESGYQVICYDDKVESSIRRGTFTYNQKSCIGECARTVVGRIQKYTDRGFLLERVHNLPGGWEPVSDSDIEDDEEDDEDDEDNDDDEEEDDNTSEGTRTTDDGSEVVGTFEVMSHNGDISDSESDISG